MFFILVALLSAPFTDGQTLVIVPKKDTIIITLAHQNDITEIEKIINDILFQL